MAVMAAADRRWKLGYNTLTWAETRDPDLERVFATIRESGWEGIELLDNDANWSGPPSRVRGMLERVGLPVVAMLGGVQIDDARRARQLELQKRMIDYGAELGCEAYVFIGGDRVFRRLTSDDDIRRLADVAHELVEYAEPLGMTVNHHSHPRCTVEREEEQDRLLAIADPRLRVCIDIGISVFMDEDYLGQIEAVRRADGIRPPQGLGATASTASWARGRGASTGPRCWRPSARPATTAG